MYSRDMGRGNSREKGGGYESDGIHVAEQRRHGLCRAAGRVSARRGAAEHEPRARDRTQRGTGRREGACPISTG